MFHEARKPIKVSSYHRPFAEAKRIQESKGTKNLPGIFKKYHRWYCRVALVPGGEKPQLGFETEKEAYACYVGITRTKSALDRAA